MSRSSPPPSPTAGSPPNDPDARPAPGRAQTARRRLGIRFAAIVRWLHIYLSMFGLASVLFFAVTGLTLNHPAWFFADVETVRDLDGSIDPAWLHLQSDGPEAVDRLAIVEHLRAEHRVGGALADFTVDDYECIVTFKGPGYSADAFIDRESGTYTLTEVSRGLVAVINDLHKGRDTGPAWSVVIDVSAVLLTALSLTGLLLIFYLKLRRVPGVAVAIVGTIAIAVVVWLWVP